MAKKEHFVGVPCQKRVLANIPCFCDKKVYYC